MASKKKTKAVSIDSLFRKLPKIIPFDEIQSVQQSPLPLSKSRDGRYISSIGSINLSGSCNIYSFEITPDIHKVVIKNVFIPAVVQTNAPTALIVGLSVKDIPDLIDTKKFEESIVTNITKYEYTKEEAQKEVDNANAELANYADPFLNSNTMFLQASIPVSSYADSKGTFEFIIPPGLFKGREEKKAYLFVSSAMKKATPTVTPYTYPEDTYFFYEEPAAEALTVGDKLGASRIMLGEVRYGKETISGTYIWKNPATKISNSGEDVQNHPAIFIPLEKSKLLDAVTALLQKELAQKNPGTPTSILEKTFKKIKYPVQKLKIYEASIKVPVYPKNDKQFFSFVWRTNDIVKKEFVEKDLNHPRRHHTYQGMYDNYSIGQVYNTPASFSTTTTTYAVDQVVRGLLAQPKGKRNISIDGNVLLLIGGAQYEGQQLKYVHFGNETNQTSFEKKDKRLTRDFLYSMVYSAPMDQSTTDSYSGEGFLFFDSPIHYNHPKVIPGREIDSSLVTYLKKKQLFAKYLISLQQRIDFAKTYFSDWLNIGDPDDESDKRPTSGCHALLALLKNIFTEVKRYNIDIDYVYSDLEGIYNTGWFLKTHHRIEHCYGETKEDSNELEENSSESKENSNLFNISLHQTDGKLDFKKMWNAVCESERFQKEILPKLESRGFHPYEQSKDSTEIYLDAVNNAFWRKGFTQIPSFGYWGKIKNYGQRRELNIWDCVMTEYTADLQQKYVMDVFTEYNPNVKYSIYAHSAASGHSHYGTYGLFFEPSLGGSITLPKTMSSCTSLYGGDACEGHCKFNIDDYRCFVRDYSAFAFCKNEINHIRADRNNNPNGIMPFYSCQFYRKYHNINQDKTTFYNDILFHTWLCQPKQMIAYFNYDPVIKKALEKDDSQDYQKAYYRQCYQDAQKVLDELNDIIKEPIVKTLDTPIVNECDPFILTGVETKTERIWRLTYDDKKYAKTSCIQQKKATVLNIWIAKKNIAFNNGVIRKIDANGFWIATPKKTEPNITTDEGFFETNPSFYVESPFESTFTPISNKNTTYADYSFRHSKGVMLFGENAPFQIWETKILFDKINPSAKLFKTNISELEGIKEGKWYTFVAKVEFPKPSCIYGDTEKGASIKEELDKSSFKIKLTYDIDEKTTITKEYKVPVESTYAPILSIELGKGSNAGSIHCEYFKILIDGKNIRADIFRKCDGVNITRVNREFEEFKDSKLERTSCLEPLEAKISWLNAEDTDETYTIWIGTERNMIGSNVSVTQIDTITVRSNDQGYKILPLPKLNQGHKSVSIIIKDSNDKTVFNMKSPVLPKIRL